MYGIVNRSIQDFVKTNYGEDKWQAIKDRSGTYVDFFIISQSYDDDITYKLAGAVSIEMDIHHDDLMQALGEWMVVKIGKENYGMLLDAGGETLKEFLINLPMFNNRIRWIYPELNPPEFEISNIGNNSIYIHCFLKNRLFCSAIKGMLQGIGIVFQKTIDVAAIQHYDNIGNSEVFKVSW